MTLKENILEIACKKNACITGIDKLLEVNTAVELIDCYFRYIDFCLAKKVPNMGFIRANFDNKLLMDNGVYLDTTGKENNLKRCAVIGRSNMTLNYDGYSVGRIYAADNSKVEINASGKAYVIVDAVDTAKITVNSSDNAKVIVSAYRNTEVSGNAKIIRKKTSTYDL